jgi:hypothetical protein
MPRMRPKLRRIRSGRRSRNRARRAGRTRRRRPAQCAPLRPESARLPWPASRRFRCGRHVRSDVGSCRRGRPSLPRCGGPSGGAVRDPTADRTAYERPASPAVPRTVTVRRVGGSKRPAPVPHLGPLPPPSRGQSWPGPDREAMRVLARGVDGEMPVLAGESGAAGVAALMALHGNGEARGFGLDEDARVLLVNTEGATAPALYESLVGISPAEVLRNPEMRHAS